MTPKEETQSRYGIIAPAETPDQAVALPPGGTQPNPVSGGGFGPVSQTEITVRQLANQATMLWLLNLRGWQNQVQAYRDLGMANLAPPAPPPVEFHVAQAQADGKIIVEWQTFIHGIPMNYEFQSSAWCWFY